MIIRVLGYANAQAIFDYFNGKGVTWGEPTKKNDNWHTIRVNIPQHDYFTTKWDCIDAFPKARLSFK